MPRKRAPEPDFQLQEAQERIYIENLRSSCLDLELKCMRNILHVLTSPLFSDPDLKLTPLFGMVLIYCRWARALRHGDAIFLFLIDQDNNKHNHTLLLSYTDITICDLDENHLSKCKLSSIWDTFALTIVFPCNQDMQVFLRDFSAFFV